MDNNKIVDNLNFIKIYFKGFIYKIIVPKKVWIMQKRDKKNHRLRMKTRLGVRTGSKTLERESKTHPNTKVCSASKSTIRHFWSAEFSPFGLWPNSLRVTIRHTIFYLLAEGWVLIHVLHVRALFWSLLASINRDWIS